MPALTTDRRTALALVATLPLAAFAPPLVPPSTFAAALETYDRAKAAEEAMLAGPSLAESWSDDIVERLDSAVDALVATPSPDGEALAAKICILADEYRGDVQGRHFLALAADAQRLSGAAWA